MHSSKRFFKLRSDLMLRGWTDVRRALVVAGSQRMVLLTKAAFDALELALGGVSIDSPVMLPVHRNAIKELVANGFGEMTQDFCPAQAFQRFKAAPCCRAAFIHWSVTGRCNMKCRHCFVEAPEAHYGEMTLADCVRIMDQMVDANIHTVSLTGGEPLIRAKWREFYAELKNRRIGVSVIYTNGLVLTDKWLDAFAELEDCKIAFSLSFDGVGCHDWLRGREGAEPLLIDAVERLVERGYPVEIETALYKENAQVMPQTCELLARLGVRTWKLSKIVDSVAWRPYAKDHDISREELNACYLALLDVFERLGRPFSLQLDHRYIFNAASGRAYLPALVGDGRVESIKRPVCSCMRQHPYLLPDGTLMPCMPLANCGLDRNMPNLLEVPLVEVLKPESKFFNFISMTPEQMFAQGNSTCASCKYREVCCSGCRARAHAAGDILGPDPEMCAFFKMGERQMFEPHCR